MRSRFVIPAALLVTVAYVKGRLDASLFRSEEEPAEVPVAVPPVDPILRAQAEAADALSIAEAQTVTAAAPVVEDTPVAEDLPVVEEAPVAEELPVVEDAPVITDAPVADDAPVVDDVPAPLEPAIDSVAVVEELVPVDEPALADETAPREDVPAAEDPVAEEAPAEPAPVAEDGPAAPADAESEETARRDLSHLSEWLTTPTWGAPPPRRARARERFDPDALARWVTHPASGAPRRARAREAFDPARLAEWVTNPTWGPLRRTMVRDVLDAAALAEWATDPVWGQTRRTRTRDAFEAAAVSEWITHVAPTALPEWEGVPEEPAAPAPAAGSETPEPAAEAVPPAVEPVPDPQPQAETVAEVRIDESGRFSLGGWAAQPGSITLCGVTFRDRRDAPVDPSAIRLIPDAVSNVGDGGLVVLADPGFAPDQDGFTLLLAADGPGSFAASGRYEVLAA